MTSPIHHAPARVPAILLDTPDDGPPAAVTRAHTATGDQVWLVRDQTLARQLLGDPRFSRAAAALPGAPALNSSSPVPDSITTRDGAEHRRIRQLVAGWFTPRRLATLAPYVERTAEELAADLGTQPPPVDLVASYATALPLSVLLHLVGIPPEDRDLFTSHVNVLFDSDASDPVVKRRRGIELAGYMAALIGRLRTGYGHGGQPAPGVLGSLVEAHDRGELTRSELVNLGLALLTAGYETTADQIGMSVLAVLRDPTLRAAVLDPHRAPGAVEEMLRLLPATPVTFARVALQRTRLADVTVEAGEAVVVSILAANRDATQSACPHRMATDGGSAPHVTFGYGPHYCVGAPLARLQISVALRTLLHSFPTLRLAGPDAVSWKEGLLTCGLAGLTVSW
jgi:cytochrome P450